ncbi:hypothetical protein ACGFSI_19700 [Streptomyces virginiae]|uniref:hypothetical protein n=1 Tax=Streptomyces virginiae TaxID=1961 RepID=UPI00371341BF
MSGAVQYTAWLYCTLALQQLFGHAAWTAATLLLLAVPLTALTVFPRSFATRLRTPARIIGFLATAAGLLWLTTGLSHPDTFPALGLAGALALVGVGTATLRCPPSGLEEGAQRAFDAHTKYSGALAVALTTSLITAHAHTKADGYDTVLIVCAEVAVVAALVGTARARRPKKPPEPGRAPETRP